MNEIETEKLFSAVDETKHEYTWDYTTRDAAIALLDVNGNYFAMISERREIADETATAQDYRDNTWYIWHLYLKSDFRPVEELSGFSIIQSFVFSEGRHKEIGRDKLIDEMRKNLGGADIKEADSILSGRGKVYILDGNLMLDKVQK